MDQKEVKQQRPSNSIEALVRASVAEYNTWLVYNYLEMDLLVKLLKGRRSNLSWDISFENKVLWALVHSNENYREVKADQSRHHELISLFLTKYNRGDQDFLDFKKGESAKFPGVLRGLLMSLAGHLELKTNFPCLRQMDKDAISHMLPFLTTQDQVSLFSTCKALHEKSELIKPINKLLSLVARGEQDKAEAMIRKNPELLLQSGDITDGAGRNFKNITPLQYAVWALDAHMWTMMLPLFSDAVHIDAAADQLQALEEKGTAHGRHFDFKPLLDAYAAFLANPSDETWRRVGEAQGLLPDHVLQEFMTPDRPFEPTPNFAVASGRRVSVHRPLPTLFRVIQGLTQFSQLRAEMPGPHAPHKLSRTRQVGVRGSRIGPGVRGTGGYSWERVEWRALQDDSYTSFTRAEALALYNEATQFDATAFSALCRQRGAELTDLLRRYGVEPSSAAESKSPGPGR